jgi:argininosuccinate lyase
MLWGGRFAESMNERMARYNNSYPFDCRMWAEDIRGSKAWARQIHKAGVLSAQELEQILNGLDQVAAEYAEDRFEVKPSDEDIHSAVERRLAELIGSPALKLHSGRSRNDQVATDVRLWTIGAIERADAALREVQKALLAQAEAAGEAVMPGYTHVQRAQPILASHWLMKHFWPLERDRARLADCAKRTAILPLGSAALAGTPLNVDRQEMAQELGFSAPTPNSLDAVSDRDFVAEYLFIASMIAIHISQLAEDIVFYSSTEFGFVSLADAYSTGSSIMPQKKNPDSFELARGKSGRVIGSLITLLTVLKGLPSTYNKDMQEDKEPLFDAADTIELTLSVVAGAIETMTLRYDRMLAALDTAMLATDLADYLVTRGVPFREAHHALGVLVREAEQKQIELQGRPQRLRRRSTRTVRLRQISSLAQRNRSHRPRSG